MCYVYLGIPWVASGESSLRADTLQDLTHWSRLGNLRESLGIHSLVLCSFVAGRELFSSTQKKESAIQGSSRVFVETPSTRYSCRHTVASCCSFINRTPQRRLVGKLPAVNPVLKRNMGTRWTVLFGLSAVWLSVMSPSNLYSDLTSVPRPDNHSKTIALALWPVCSE
jgi:hypothetical protein